jgi:hypothetical protein
VAGGVSGQVTKGGPSKRNAPHRESPRFPATYRGDRFGDAPERSGLIHGLMRSVPVVMGLELAQDVAQVVLVPDEGAVQEFVAAGLHPPFP